MSTTDNNNGIQTRNNFQEILVAPDSHTKEENEKMTEMSLEREKIVKRNIISQRPHNVVQRDDTNSQL